MSTQIIEPQLPPKRLAKYQKLMERFDAYIEANLTEPLYNDDCARVLGISARSLANVVQALHGVPTQRYLRTRRLNAVREQLMQQGRTQIKQVARGHGFAHLGEFCAEYKKQFGELPSETRAQALGRSFTAPVVPQFAEMASY